MPDPNNVNELYFDVDLDSLTSSLNKAQKAIEDAFSKAQSLSAFDSSVDSASAKVEALISKMGRLQQGSDKFAETAAATTNELNKLATALQAVGDKQGALAAGAAADMWSNIYGLPGKGFGSGPFRSSSGAFISAGQYASNQTAGALKGELDRITAQRLASDKAAIAQENAMWDNYYSQLAQKAEAAAQAQARAIEMGFQAERTAMTETKAQLNALVLQLKEAGNGWQNAWKMQVPGSSNTFNEFRQQIEAAGFNMRSLDNSARSMWERQIGLMGNHILQWGGFIALIQGATAAISGLENGLREGVRTAAEFQQQMVQLHSLQHVGTEAGVKFGPATDSEVWTTASRLAIQYGDNVNDVVQDLMMWYKTTGDLNNAMYITNEALKFQITTGTDLEDTYRTLTALQNQASGMKMGLGDNSTFDMSKTADFLNKIYTAALVAGGGMRQLGKDGEDMGVTTANAANVLMHAMEQDTEALKKLGLNMSEAIALDQALITSMGNTGGAADSAAERLARLVGGFMELSRSSKAAAVEKDLGVQSYDTLQKILSSNQQDGEMVKQLVTFWDTLNDRQKNALSVALAGNRQYQIQQNVMDSLAGTYNRILQAEKDKSALDTAAKQMNDTFNQQVRQLQAEWQVVAKIIGEELIPILQVAISLAARFAVGIANITANAKGGGEINAVLAAHGANISNSAQNAPGPAQSFLKAHDDATNAATLSNYLEQRIETMYQISTQTQKKVLDQAEGYLKAYSGNEVDLVRGLSSFRANSSFGGRTLLQIIAPELMGTSAAQAGSLSYDVSHLKDEIMAQYVKNNLGIGANAGSSGSASPADVTPSSKGIRDAAQQQGTALEDLTTQYHAYLDVQKDVISSDEAQIQGLTRKMQIYGETNADVNQMKAIYEDENQTMSNTNKALVQYRAQFEAQLASAEKARSGTAQNTVAYNQWTSAIAKAQTEINSINKAIQDNTNAQTENQYKVIEAQNSLANTSFEKYMTQAQRDLSQSYKQYELGLTSLSAIEARRNSILQQGSGYLNQFVAGTKAAQDAQVRFGQSLTDVDDRLVQMNESLAKTFNEQISKYQNDLVNTMLSVNPRNQNPAELDYEKQMVQLKQQEAQADHDLSVLSAQAAGTDWSDQIEQLDRLENAYFGTAEAAAALKEKQSQVLSSPEYQATSQMFNSLDSSVATTVTNSLFGVDQTNQQIYAIQQEIQSLSDAKTMEQEIYDSYTYHSQQEVIMHNERMLHIRQETQALEQQKQALEQKLSNPSPLKKLVEDFSKSLIDGMMKEWTNQALNSIFTVKPDPALNQAFNNLQTYLKQSFENPVNDFTQSIGAANASDYTFVGAVANFGQYVQNFSNTASGMAGSGGSGGGGSTVSGNGWSFDLNSIGNDLLQTGAGSSGGSSGGFDTGSFMSAPRSGGGGGLGNFAIPAAIGLGAIAFPAIASMLRQPGVPTGGAGLPAIGSGSMLNNGSGSWMSTANASSLQDFAFLQSPSNSSTDINATNQWLAPFVTGTPNAASLGLGTGAPSLTGVGNSVFGSGNPNPFGQPGSPAWQAGQATSAPGGSSASKFGGIGGLSGKGLWSSAGSMGKYLGIAGGVMGLYSAITGGGGLGNAVSAAMSMAQIAGWTGPVGIGLDALAFITGLIGIGPHDNPAAMPDKYNTSVFGQGVANLLGFGYGGEYGSGPYNANGQAFKEDPSLEGITGPAGFVPFIEKQLAQYGTAQNAPAWLQPMFNNLVKLFGMSSTGAGQFHFGHNIAEDWITGASGVDGSIHNYQDYLTAMNNFIQAYTNNLQNAGQMTIVALNQFGSAVGFLPANWDTPGYDYTNNPASNPTTQGGTPQPPPTTGTGTGGTTTPPPPGTPGSGNYGGGGNTHSAYSYAPRGGNSPSVVAGNITVTTNIDGREVARSTQGYMLRVGRQGFQRIS